MSASPKRPMTEEEVVAATMLQHVNAPPASWDKRAIATIRFSLTLTPPLIGEKMVPQLWRLLYRYRRQLKHPKRAFFLKMAEQRMAPDLRKQQAALNEQSRIDALKKESSDSGKPEADVSQCQP